MDQDPPEGFVQNYCLLIGDRSFSNFQKVCVSAFRHVEGVLVWCMGADPMSQILDLKGTPRGDQQKLLDIFLSVTSHKDDLQDTSFLTSIDMDPSSSDKLTTPSSSAFSPTNTGSASGLPSLLSRNNSQSQGDHDGGRETPKAFGDFRRLVSFATRRD
jgi:hypothetical protein